MSTAALRRSAQRAETEPESVSDKFIWFTKAAKIFVSLLLPFYERQWIELNLNMEKFQPYSLDYDTPAQGELLGEVKAGFPSPAEDIREKLDLIKLLVRHKASTFFFRVSGVSMVDADMDEGDIIIVDRAVQPYNNCKAVCFIDGEYTVKRIEIGDGIVRLMPANEANTKYQPIEVTQENNFMVWGVVTYVIKKM